MSSSRVGIIGCAAALAALGLGFALSGWGSRSATARHGADILVSQRGHVFTPARIRLARGDRIAVVNDDGNALHHVYVEEGAMRFDSGEMPPGARAIVPFDAKGRFAVLCGIHPGMRLDVEVR